MPVGAKFMAMIRRFERTAISVLMIAMPLVYCFNVGVRVLLPSLAPALAWIEELVLFGLAWLVFLGLGLALERGRHIAMTALFDRLPASLRGRIGLLINLTGLGFSLFIAKAGCDLTMFVLKSGQISPTLNVTMAWLYLPLPIGFALLSVRYLMELVRRPNRFSVAERGMEH